MTREYIINKLTCELVMLTGDTDSMSSYRKYIAMALDIGVNHFTKDMEEIIAMDKWGNELNRFKSTQDAAEKLGIYRQCITDVLIGRANTAGGLRFIKAKDKVLIPKTDKYGARKIHSKKICRITEPGNSPES